MPNLTISHEFQGLVDYWGGNGDRWDDNAGCLFAHYGRNTTLRDCVDQWVDEFCSGGDCDSFDPEITESDLRKAILDSMSRDGREDYENGALAECAIEFGNVDPCDECDECDSCIGQEHEPDCSHLKDAEGGLVCEEDTGYNDDMYESPVWIVLVKYEACPVCGKWADCGDNPKNDDCCESCFRKRWIDDSQPSILYNFDEWYDRAVKRICA